MPSELDKSKAKNYMENFKWEFVDEADELDCDLLAEHVAETLGYEVDDKCPEWVYDIANKIDLLQ